MNENDPVDVVVKNVARISMWVAATNVAKLCQQEDMVYLQPIGLKTQLGVRGVQMPLTNPIMFLRLSSLPEVVEFDFDRGSDSVWDGR